MRITLGLPQEGGRGLFPVLASNSVMPATHRARRPRQELRSGTLIRPVGGPHPAFPVSPGLSHSDFIRPVWGLTGALTGALTSWLAASPAALHQTGRDEGGSTADPAGPPGRQKAQVRRLLPPTGVGRRRGWRDGRRGAAAPSSTGAPGPRRLAPTEGRARAAGRHACASGFNPPKGSTE